MAKIFYTERDIQDMVSRGVTTLDINDNVVLTDVARELAFKHNLRLVRVTPAHPADSAEAQLIHRVKAAVLARVGGEVDPTVLEAVIAKVIKSLGD